MKIRKSLDGFIRALALSSCLLATAASPPLAAAQPSVTPPHALVSTVARTAQCRAHQAAKHVGASNCMRLDTTTSSNAKPQGYLWGISIPWLNGYLWPV